MRHAVLEAHDVHATDMAPFLQAQGSYPGVDASVTALQALTVENNRMTGTIPVLDGLTALRQLYLCNNSLTGTIPALQRLTALRQVLLHENQLRVLGRKNLTREEVPCLIKAHSTLF